MADEIIKKIIIETDASSVQPAVDKVAELGNTTDVATQKIGGLRKEMRAVGEVSKMSGEAFGDAGGGLSKVGEGARMAYAGMELLNGGLKELAVTIMANPIFLIGAAIAAIVVVTKEMNDAEEASRKAMKDYADTVLPLIEKERIATIDLAVAKGNLSKVEAANMKGEMDRQKTAEVAYSKYRDALIDTDTVWYSIMGGLKKTADAKNLEEEKVYNESLALIRATAREEEHKRALEAFDEESKSNPEFNGENAKKAAEAWKKKIEASGKAWKEEIKLKEEAIDIENKRDEIAGKQFVDEEKSKTDALKKELDARIAAQKLANEDLKSIAEGDKSGMENPDNEYPKKLAYAKKYYKDLDALAKGNYILANIEAKDDFDKQVAAATKFNATLLKIKADEIKAEDKLKKDAVKNDVKIAQQGAAAIGSISDAMFAAAENRAKGNAAHSKQLAKEQFEVNKALGIANTVIHTAEAVMTSLATYPAPVGPVLAALDVVVGVAEVAAISSTSFDDSSQTPAAAPSASVPTAAPTAASFNPSTVNQAGNIQQQPAPKTYVSVVEISNKQRKVGMDEKRASF